MYFEQLKDQLKKKPGKFWINNIKIVRQPYCTNVKTKLKRVWWESVNTFMLIITVRDILLKKWNTLKLYWF